MGLRRGGTYVYGWRCRPQSYPPSVPERRNNIVTTIVHPSVEERKAQGKAARATGRSRRPRRMDARAGPTRSRRVARSAEHDARARSRARPSRAHDGLAVHVLSGCGEDHGRRPEGHPDRGTERPAVWRRASLELRRVRITGTKPGVRPERLRRNASRSVRVRRQAHGRELHDRGAQQRLQQDRRPRRDTCVRDGISRGHDSSSPGCRRWTSGTRTYRNRI